MKKTKGKHARKTKKGNKLLIFAAVAICACLLVFAIDYVKYARGRSSVIDWQNFGDKYVSAAERFAEEEIPEYVIQEVSEVAERARQVITDESIVFIAMSDSHHYGQQQYSDKYADTNGIQNNESNLHAAMAVGLLNDALDIDFLAHLGDMTWGSRQTTTELLKSHVMEVTGLIGKAVPGVPVFYAIGNHDSGIYYHEEMNKEGKTGIYTTPADFLYENFTARSASDNTVIAGSEYGGYCYRDFPDKKLRVFLLNTSEELVKSQRDGTTTPEQRIWFAEALLDLNTKADADQWQFIVLSHYPADYGGTMPLSALLKAYIEGGTISITAGDGNVSEFSFDGRNSSGMIAQFHGHVHNLIASTLSVYEGDVCESFDAWRVCVPNGQYNRENYYDTVGNYTEISFAQEQTYAKTPGSGEDTSFVVNVVNPSEKTIYSFCYGAGYDRTIAYGEDSGIATEAADGEEGNDAPEYVNWLTRAQDSLGEVYGYKTGCRLNSSGIETKSDNSCVSGYIPVKAGDIVYMKNVFFEKKASGVMSGGLQRIVYYDSAYHIIGIVNASSNTEVQQRVYDGNFLVQFTVADTSNMSVENVAYFRISCPYLGEDSIITVNEPITVE